LNDRYKLSAIPWRIRGRSPMVAAIRRARGGFT
jgi:hypothetical protein